MQKFLKAFSCLLIPLRPNITTYFELIHVSRPTFKSSPCSLKHFAWPELLSKHPGPLHINLSIILYFRAKLGYKGLPNAFILLKNLVFILKDEGIINKKLFKDLGSRKVKEVIAPTPRFISFPLNLVFKHNKG